MWLDTMYLSVLSMIENGFIVILWLVGTGGGFCSTHRLNRREKKDVSL